MPRAQAEPDAPPVSQHMAWDAQAYSLQADEMDRQHDTLLLLMNELVRRDVEGADKQDLSELLDELCSLTLAHFQAEEACMQATGYGRLDIHGLIHSKLIAKLREHMQVFRDGNGRLGRTLVSFFEFWLAAHIKGADQHYARHVSSQNERVRTAR
jgi:hemerythrin-like metal-binding protein